MTVLREGYTTGSCATAAALASCLWRKSGVCPDQVELILPCGRAYRPEIFAHEFPRCGVVKDAGDDPDITNGMEVIAWVDLPGGNGDISFHAGEGVGIVTEPGLKVPVGEAAINPVPRKMIAEAVRRVFPAERVCVTVSIPGGLETAKKTFNPRLGVRGGLSILGTTGVVRPMSEDAICDTVRLELEMRRVRGAEVALTFGNQGEEALLNAAPQLHGRIVQMSNYVGFALDTALELKYRRVLLAGHPGKLVKLAAGVMQTHSRFADARREALAAHLALLGADRAVIEEVFACRTTDAALPLIDKAGYSMVWDRLADAGQSYSEARIRNAIEIDVLFLIENGKSPGKSARLREEKNRWIGL